MINLELYKIFVVVASLYNFTLLEEKFQQYVKR